MSPPTPQDPDFFAGLGSPAAHGLDEAELRARLARFYRSHEGLRSSGKTEAEYEALLFPNDRPAWRRLAADSMWSCALRFLAVCRLLGIPHPLLKVPYETRIGKAVIDAAAVARTFGALVEGEALDAYEPSEGDALCSLGRAGPHVSCVVGVESPQGPGAAPARVLVCVDGGAGRKGDMAIAANFYLWTPGRLRSVEPPQSLDRPGPPAALVWVVNAWNLVLNAGLLKA
jgi:hypothetical protein